MNHFARLTLVARKTRVANPVGQAIPAKTGQAHQVYILCIVAVVQMPNEPAECGGSNRVGQGIERIIRFWHFLSLCCGAALT